MTERTPDQGQEPTGESRNASNMMILLPEQQSTDDGGLAGKQGARSGIYRRRRLAVLAGVIAVAAVCGAAGGSLATIALGHLFASQETRHETKALAADEMVVLKDAIARINADVKGFKADIDRSGKERTAQIGKLGERLDKVERAQDDASAKAAKIADAQIKDQDKLRTANVSASAETTGSIPAPGSAKPDINKTDANKVENKKPAIVEGWTISRVSGGGALVDGPAGLYEAYPGDPLPGLGRVDAVRYQDGRWVVVTQKGLIVRR